MINPFVAQHLPHLPFRAGVYLFKDSKGNVIYVGKANKLRNRVRSYFQKSEGLTEKTRQLVTRIRDIDYFVTNSEQEALVLEQNMVKRFRPYYNIRLKDDKTFPFLKIDLNEEFPRVYITRRVLADGGRYFGPFTSPWSVRETLKVLKKIFRFRTCTGPVFGVAFRACLEYHIGQCVGPCVRNVAKEEYATIIKQVTLFLEGKQDTILKHLKSKMEKAAESLDFEKAAVTRDQIIAIERVIEGQKIAFPVSGEQDIIAFAAEKDIAAVQVFFVRDGRVIGRETFTLQGVSLELPSQIMTSFVKQYYSTATHVPPLVMLQNPLEDKLNIERWLGSRRGSRVRIQVPARSKKKQLVQMVAANAELGLEQMKLKQSQTPADLNTALSEIQKELNLPRLPERIECYDVSNIQGKMPVGSLVVFEMGKPKPSDYRRFRIKTVDGADDYAMLAEVLQRRFKRIVTAHPEPVEGPDQTLTLSPPKDSHWAKIPDLVLIDGGKGQLNTALAAMKEAGVEAIPAAGLAKEKEAVFVPGRALPIVLPPSSPARQLLQRLRDEAHRFAVTYHRKLRKKESFASVLDTVPGIGRKRKRALLRRFGSVKAIRAADTADIATAEGINSVLARKLKEYL